MLNKYDKLFTEDMTSDQNILTYYKLLDRIPKSEQNELHEAFVRAESRRRKIDIKMAKEGWMD